MKEALLWKSLENKAVQCNLCNHRCKIQEGKKGICQVRENRQGALFSLNYGKVVALNVDPIEKKPLFHFHPGTTAFSVASSGCNFRCTFCQNHSISQSPREERINGRELTPQELIQLAKNHNCQTIAHTYTEPTIYFEHAIESAQLARDEGMKTIFVTNGFMSPEAAKMMVACVDGANIDLKAFSEETYKKTIGGALRPVLDNIAFLHEEGILLEITTLVVPDMNDSDEELGQIASFIHSVSPNIPWHVSRFHPDYQMLDRPPTPTATVQRARNIGIEKGLRYVYCGNLPGDDGESTICYNCKEVLVKRWGYRIVQNNLQGNKCPKCSTEHYFVTN